MMKTYIKPQNDTTILTLPYSNQSSIFAGGKVKLEAHGQKLNEMNCE